MVYQIHKASPEIMVRSNKKYPLDTIQIGDAFPVPYESETQFKNLRTHLSREGKRLGAKFRAKIWEVGANKTIEVARVG